MELIMRDFTIAHSDFSRQKLGDCAHLLGPHSLEWASLDDVYTMLAAVIRPVYEFTILVSLACYFLLTTLVSTDMYFRN